MTEHTLEQRVAFLERDLQHTQEFASLLLTVLIGKQVLSEPQFSILRAVRYLGGGLADDHTALNIEGEAAMFLEDLKDSQFADLFMAQDDPQAAQRFRDLVNARSEAGKPPGNPHP